MNRSSAIRGITFAAALLVAAAWVGPSHASVGDLTAGSLPVVGAQESAPAPTVQPPADQKEVNVRVNVSDGQDLSGPWYFSPFWVGVGIIAALLIIVLVVMAARGGQGTATVVKT